MRAVILAGGKGTRLRPYTYSLPKPLMPVGEMPILEIILRQLKKNGFEHITIAVNYMARIIQAFFQDGKDWDLKINYSLEKKPLGTIGPLTLIEDLPENFLVMNGDILTNLCYKDFFNWHLKNKNDISIGSFNKKIKLDYGVIKFNEQNEILEFIEKPDYFFNINMGIYMIKRKVIESLPRNEPYGVDQLIIKCHKENLKIKIYQGSSYWVDIGNKEDFKKLNKDFQLNKKELLGL